MSGKKGVNRKHGGSGTRVYRIWLCMRRRCADLNCKYYGAKGVTVCDRWSSFENFHKDMGDPPTSNHSIDRFPDAKGNYEPGNCRWATFIEQNRNRKSNHLITRNGETKPLIAWCEELGVSPELVSARISRHNWDAERALTSPVTQRDTFIPGDISDLIPIKYSQRSYRNRTKQAIVHAGFVKDGIARTACSQKVESFVTLKDVSIAGVTCPQCLKKKTYKSAIAALKITLTEKDAHAR